MAGPPTHRKYEWRCHVCKFCEAHSDGAEFLETWLATGSKSLEEIADYFNTHEYWQDKHEPFTYQKLYNHREKHLSNTQDILKRARQDATDGNATLERSVIDAMTGLHALQQQALEAIGRGEIKIEDPDTYMKLIKTQQGLLGGGKIEINIGAAQRMPLLPNELLMALMQSVAEFVPASKQLDWRRSMDDKLLPVFMDYVTKNNPQLGPGIIEDAIVIKEQEQEHQDERETPPSTTE